MNTFFLTLVFVTLGQLIGSAVIFFRSKDIVLQIKKLLLWLPFQISMGFASAYLLVLTTEETNQSIISIFCILSVFGSLTLAYLVEYSELTRYDSSDALHVILKQKRKTLVFFLALILCVVPFSIYPVKNVLVLVFVPIMSIIYYILLRISNSYFKESVRARVRELILTGGDYLYKGTNPFLILPEDVQNFSHAKATEITEAIVNVEAELRGRGANVSQRLDNSLGSFSDLNIGTVYVREICREVVHDLLQHLMRVQNTIGATFGRTPAEKEESKDVLKRLGTPATKALIDLLFKNYTK